MEGILEQPNAEAEDQRASNKIGLRRKYAGEVFCELGVLILVFLPLETVLRPPSFWLEVSAVALLVGFGLVVYGIQLRVED
jgi:hypothetical protein